MIKQQIDIAIEPVETADGYLLDSRDNDLDHDQADQMIGELKPLYFVRARVLEFRKGLEQDIAHREFYDRLNQWARKTDNEHRRKVRQGLYGPIPQGRQRRPKRSYGEIAAAEANREYAWVTKSRPWLIPQPRPSNWSVPCFYPNEATALAAGDRLQRNWEQRRWYALANRRGGFKTKDQQRRLGLAKRKELKAARSTRRIP
jgi:hypothetical protein